MGSKLRLPVVKIEADNLARGWEEAVLACWEQGTRIATQYDRQGDPKSRDVSLFLAVADAFAEPRVHRAMPGGIYDLEVYRQEVVDGIHDHWIAPEEGKWQYTYHERIAAYKVPGIDEPLNQLDYIVEALAGAPHTRRAQVSIWKPWEDAGIDDPACLQRLWFRVFDDELVLSAHMRSNDAFKAAFMNMYAFTDLQRVVAERLSKRLDRQISPTQYNHCVDSFHIYGSYFDEFEGFLQSIEARTFEQRVFTSDMLEPLFEEARERISKALEKEGKADSEQRGN
ncbi:MAG: thymidylate synthase [Armatimonadota bacterium]